MEQKNYITEMKEMINNLSESINSTVVETDEDDEKLMFKISFKLYLEERLEQELQAIAN